MKVERDLNRFKRMYPDKKTILSKEHPSEVDYVIHSSVGRFKIKSIKS